MVATGLSVCIVALIFIAFAGKYGTDQDTVLALFGVGAFILGFGNKIYRKWSNFSIFYFILGTSIMYANVLAASTENTLPITRASALGTYRFWRDSGYWIGGLFLGAVADEVDIPVTIGITTIIVFLVTVIWTCFYKDERRKYASLPQPS